MIIPIRCFSCNKILADKYNYYINEIQKNKDNDEKIEENLLNKLGCNRYCCRRHFISTIDMMDII
jgi:DNA-directed RNA polymerase subunit N (RpoN/RPB10)|tara:strand:+ start:68 stop:262 length:195 start_codon:yes stop_codon:yes gene_type:complete